MSQSSATGSTEVPRLRELQVKYDAVLAENEQLYHDLRAEKSLREQYESAYRQVQADEQKDQEILRQLYMRIGPAVDATREEAANNVQSSSNANTVGSHFGDRIRKLESECAYLQAKVESLHLALRHYEDDNCATSVPSCSPHFTSQMNIKDSSSFFPSGTDALVIEREGRRRAEEQLTRCYTTLQHLRDDAAQKELFFHQQLTALQEQNTSLLEDLDMWVTGEQQTSLANAFESRLGQAAQREATLSSSSPAPAEPQVKAGQDEVEKPVRAEALKLQQMQQYLQDQEEVLALKDKSIEQLETHVRELEVQLKNTDAHPLRSLAPSSSSLTNISQNDLLQLRSEAAALQATVKRFADLYLPETCSSALFTLRIPHDHGTTEETSAEVIVRDVHSVLRYVLEVLSHELHFSPSSMLPRCEPKVVLRAHPITVVQPTTASTPYQSGETLRDPVQHLATLMRNHIQQ